MPMSRFTDDISPSAARTEHSRESSAHTASLKGRVNKKRGIAQTTEPRQFEFDAWRSVLAGAALAILTFLAFSNSFSAGFVLDNKIHLLQDPRIRELTGKNIRLIFQHTYWWPTGESGLYRPLTTLSYLLNYAVLGNATEPAGYHWINFLLHLGNVFLVYALARRLLREFWPAFFAAALWAVHPVLTESVTNMIGRADLLSAMAILSGFLMYLKATESDGPRRLTWFAGVMAVTTVGAFSKESAGAILGVIPLYELTWWKVRKQGRALLLGCTATLLPIAAMLYQRSIVLAASQPAEFPFTDNPIAGAGFWTGRLTAIELIPRYLGLTLWPATLSSDYSYAQIPLAHGALQDWLACAVALAAVIIVIALYRWNRTAFFLASFAAITYLPTSNLLFPVGTIMAERFLYMPAIGLLACLVMAIYAAGKRVKHFAPVVLCVIAIAFALRTWVRNGDWQDERAMAEASVRTSPNSYKVHGQLASVLYLNGAAGSDLDRAIKEADRALAILDSLPDSVNTPGIYRLAGGLHLAKGDSLHEHDSSQGSDEYPKALQILERSVAIDKSVGAEYDRKGGAEWARRHPTVARFTKVDPEVRWMLAAAYWRLGKAPDAAAAASEALALHPKSPEGYQQISYVFAAQDRVDDAAVALIEGALITSNPNLRLDLMDLYRSAFRDSCAITEGPHGPALNLACDLVHRQFCTASVEVVKAAVEDERWDEARQRKQDLLHQYGCPAGPLEQILPN
jgi:tetratricopeptide (TPR) repeat protein